jgi:hypothetical protein
MSALAKRTLGVDVRSGMREATDAAALTTAALVLETHSSA